MSPPLPWLAPDKGGILKKVSAPRSAAPPTTSPSSAPPLTVADTGVPSISQQQAADRKKPARGGVTACGARQRRVRGKTAGISGSSGDRHFSPPRLVTLQAQTPPCAGKGWQERNACCTCFVNNCRTLRKPADWRHRHTMHHIRRKLHSNSSSSSSSRCCSSGYSSCNAPLAPPPPLLRARTRRAATSGASSCTAAATAPASTSVTSPCSARGLAAVGGGGQEAGLSPQRLQGPPAAATCSVWVGGPAASGLHAWADLRRVAVPGRVGVCHAAVQRPRPLREILVAAPDAVGLR